jgi:hypothetical protein
MKHRRRLGELARTDTSAQDGEQPEEQPEEKSEAHSEAQSEEQGEASEAPEVRPADTMKPPVCDRCHNLQHHNKGESIVHPTISAIQRMLLESPYKRNHVYHVLDAADFPMSLIPRLHQHLSLVGQRSSNRRAQHKEYYQGKKADMSFIITRSDLLAPRKEQVDVMMPYLTEVLREALGLAGHGIRLGNLRCVSSQRGWWTKQVKEEVWDKGGGLWMVGKVNVGKSHLLENIYPKNRTKDVEILEQYVEGKRRQDDQSPEELDGEGLLPPRPEEVAFPVMPMVSHLPGTTASPIRLPFGRGKGELIDLPGLPRGDLEEHVLDKHKGDLVMRHREKAKQFSIKPGQSLVVSNLFRITPQTEDLVLLACPFIPIECHVTNTEKAKEVLAQQNHTAVTGIAKPGVEHLIKSAGKYSLEWDMTKSRSGPLTRKDAVGLKTERLHYVVYSTDILIEGVGWIELAAQVRKSSVEATAKEGANLFEAGIPSVEIFSPNGRHISSRQPLGAWMIGGKRKKPVSQRTQRPRRSMKGMKKAMKKETRALQAQIRQSERQEST